MSRVLYRAILHGPMTWKATHHTPRTNESTPFLVIFEPFSSLAILSQGTLLIPQVSVSPACSKSQVLSVFVYNDLDTAKSLLSLLYKYVDKKLTVFDLYKNEKALRLLMKSLASFHLPLEFVLRKVDCSTSSRLSARDLSNAPPSLHNGLKLSPRVINPYRFVSSIDVNRSLGTKIPSNTATNNPLQLGVDASNTNYINEPKSVKNSKDGIDSYYIRVGLDEGFYMVTSSTDLMQKVFQAIERKGPLVNRLSLNFYKTTSAETRPDSNTHTNAVLGGKSNHLLNKLTSNGRVSAVGASIAGVSDLIIQPRRSSHVTNDIALDTRYNALPNVRRRPGFYTPGPVKSPIFPGTNRSGINTAICSQLSNNYSSVPEHRVQDVQTNFNSILRPQSNGYAQRLNTTGLDNSHHSYSYSTETNVSNEKSPQYIETKDKPLQTLNSHGLTSMSTNEYYGYVSPTVNSNTNNPSASEIVNQSAVVDGVSDTQKGDFKFSDIKLTDLQLKPYNRDDVELIEHIVENKANAQCAFGDKSEPSGYEDYYEDEDGVNTNNESEYESSEYVDVPVSVVADARNKTVRLTRTELLTDPYKDVLKRLKHFVDVNDPKLDIILQQCTECKVEVKEGILEQLTKSRFANVEVVQDHGKYPINVILHPTLCAAIPKEIAEYRHAMPTHGTSTTSKVNHDPDATSPAPLQKAQCPHDAPRPDSDELSEFSETHDLYKDTSIVSKENRNENANASTTEKTTTYREDERLTSDIDTTNSARLSNSSDVNVIIDELNELSTKNELLSRDNTKYRNKVVKLKEKIANLKAIHKYELQQLMNKNSSNEERLRATINENNVTIKMMEQERLKLSELVEQQKVTLKRMNREKVDAVQQLSRIEDEHNKLQMVREIDKNEKNNYNKALSDIENLKAENEALANKLRVADEKLKTHRHSEKMQVELINDMKAKLDNLESERTRNLQIANENKIMRTRESQLKDRLDVLNKDYIATKNQLDDERSASFKLKQKNLQLQDDLTNARLSLAQFECKDDKIESKISMLEANNSVLLKNLDSSKAELETLKLQFEKVNSDKNRLEERYDQLHASVEKVERMNQSLSSELSQANKMLDARGTELQRLALMLNEQENEILRATTESNTVKAQRDKVLEEYNNMRDGVEKLQDRFKRLKNLTEQRVKNYDLAVVENNNLMNQLTSLNQTLCHLKNDLHSSRQTHDKLYSRLVARFFMLACSYNKLRRENCINKIKIRMGEYKNNTVLLRVLFRSVAVSKAKVAKRNCQMLKVVEALNMKGPTTTSMVLSKINTLMEAAYTKPAKQDKIAQLKSSFMKHSLEKDRQIKVLQTKLVSLEQLKENQQFLLDENRNLNEQIAAEQNNSHKLQQALNEQLERERLAFESESKCLYNRQFQLIRDNELLSNENNSLKQTISSLLNSEPSNSQVIKNDGLFDVKYARLKDIHDSHVYHSDLQFAQPPVQYTMSPGNFADPAEFGDGDYFNPGLYHQRVVYHRT